VKRQLKRIDTSSDTFLSSQHILELYMQIISKLLDVGDKTSAVNFLKLIPPDNKTITQNPHIMNQYLLLLKCMDSEQVVPLIEKIDITSEIFTSNPDSIGLLLSTMQEKTHHPEATFFIEQYNFQSPAFVQSVSAIEALCNLLAEYDHPKLVSVLDTVDIKLLKENKKTMITFVTSLPFYRTTNLATILKNIFAVCDSLFHDTEFVAALCWTLSELSEQQRINTIYFLKQINTKITSFSNNSSAIEYYCRAVAITSTQESIELLYNIKSTNPSFLHNAKTIEYYIKSLSVPCSISQDLLLALNLSDISHINSIIALHYCKAIRMNLPQDQALKLLQENEILLKTKVITFHDISCIYLSSGQVDRAIGYITKLLEFSASNSTQLNETIKGIEQEKIFQESGVILKIKPLLKKYKNKSRKS
jgi:hypothetical protein